MKSPLSAVLNCSILIYSISHLEISFLFCCSGLIPNFHCVLTIVNPGRNIRIFHGCEVQIENSVRGSLFGITRLCRVKPDSDPKGRTFLSAPNTHERFFFLHIFQSPSFDFNVGVAMNESCCFTLMPTILKVDVICDVTMTSSSTS